MNTDETSFSPHGLETLEFHKVRRMIAGEAVSAMGRETVESALPYTDPRDVRSALDRAEQMTHAVRFDDPIPFRGVLDIRTALAAGSKPGSRLVPESLLKVAQTADTAATLRRYFESRGEKYPLLWHIASALEVCGELVKRITAAIDESASVRDSASSKLRRIRRELDGARQGLRAKLDAMLGRLPDNVITDRVIAMRDGRPVIPVRSSRKGDVPGIVHDQSATGQTLFIEPLAAVEQANEIRSLEIEEQNEIDRILEELTDIVRSEAPRLKASIAALGELDALYAVGAYAARYDCVAPRISDHESFELVGMRHPLLHARLLAQEPKRGASDDEDPGAVPLTCKLTKDTRLVVISGPNAGGKTVALKTLGLAVAMMQAGFLIPAEHLTALPVFGNLFAEIGDEQSLEDDLSTFSSRMGDLAEVCEEADAATLVLIDELGSATDPEQGAALSKAILARLHTRGALTLTTTHLGELKEHAHGQDWALNASMEFSGETLEPTFRLIVGIPGSSYALEISRRVGLAPDIIADAEKELGQAAVKSEELIAELTTRLEEVRERAGELEAREAELEAKEADYESRFDKVNAERNRIRREARREAEEILSGARSLIEQTVAELRSTKGATEAIKNAHRETDKALKDVREKRKRERGKNKPGKPEGLRVGNWVRLTALNQEGELVDLTKERAAVQTESARLEVPLSAVEKLADAAPTTGTAKDAQSKVSIPSSADTFKNELDLRGMVFDEAWQEVDRALDEAQVLNYPSMRIIHGKGTGALRAKLTERFARDPRIAKHRMADWNQGGAGVTVLELKT